MCLLQRIKRNLVGEEVKGVGVMKDDEAKFEDIETSHTLGEYRKLPSEQSFIKGNSFFVFNYFLLQEGKRGLKRIHLEGCRCNERLKDRTEGATRLVNRIRWVVTKCLSWV